MRLSINIEELFGGRAVEGNRIEDKMGWNPDAIYRTICAFANDFDEAGGGYIIVGVKEENGRAICPVIGIEPDKIETDEERSYFLIDIPCHPYFVKEGVVLNTDEAKSGVKGDVKELTDIQGIIIKEMLVNPSITTSEMAQKTGIKFRTLQRHISQLQSIGIVVRVGGRKDGHWEIVTAT